MRYIVALLIGLLSGPALAADYDKEDFAYGYSLEIDGSGAVYVVALPEDVYSSTVATDLGDIRVFNEHGEQMPHEIRPAPAKVGDVAVEIPFFPLYRKKVGGENDLSVEIRRDSSGDIVSIHGVEGVSGGDGIAAYLFDMEKAGPYPLRLRLEWPDAAGFMTPVTVQTSDDLMHWQDVTDAVLADLEFMGNRLVHRQITVDGRAGRFLRLTVADREKTLSIEAAEAVSGPETLSQQRQWLSVPLRKKEQDHTTFLEAEMPGPFLVDRLSLVLPQTNSILLVNLQSRIDSGGVWRNHGNYLSYRLLGNDNELHNEPLVVSRSTGRHIRFRVLQDGMGLGATLPELRLGYVPHELLFIARGQGPFILAFGNGSMREGGDGTGLSLQELKDKEGRSLLRAAVVRDRLVLGGAAALTKKSEVPWMKCVLWLVLLTGVVLLGFMVRSLRTKMHPGAGTSP
jgi:hypothetical protein